jgi:hypothetical protein
MIPVVADGNMLDRVIFDSVSCGLDCLLEEGTQLPRRLGRQGGNGTTGDRVLNPPVNDASDRNSLASEAVVWVIRLHSGAATSHDAEALAQWRRISSDHATAFRDALKLWRAFGDAARDLLPLGRMSEP